MVASIVVPLDGSPVAESAVCPGLVLARAWRSELVLVRATWHRPPDEEARYLDGVVTHVREQDREVPIRATTVHGFADSGIAHLLAEVPDPVLCLSTRGHSGFGGATLGSVAHDIIGRTGVPAVVVGPSLRADALTGDWLLYACDGSPATAAHESVLAEWAQVLGLSVRVVTVVPAGDERGMSDLVERLQERGVTAEGQVLGEPDAARAITDLAGDAEAKVALIAAGLSSPGAHHGLTRLSRTLLGSTADRIVHHAPVPVLALRGPGRMRPE